MGECEFEELSGKVQPLPGLVLRMGGEDCRYLRITHAFDHCVYAMRVHLPAGVRNARRPFRIRLHELSELIKDEGTAWGKLVLPGEFTQAYADGSGHRVALIDTAWEKIAPLVEHFSHERNLGRAHFKLQISARAALLEISYTTTLRTLLRYYYFGGTRLALLPLQPGPKAIPPGAGVSKLLSKENLHGEMLISKRRGPRSVLEPQLGRSDFIVSESDIQDMVSCLKQKLRKGPTAITHAHESYIGDIFRRRHPELFKKYLAKACPEPVTVRMYRYYVSNYAQLSEEFSVNLRGYSRSHGRTGGMRAVGPGEIAEVDATGLRFVLVAKDDPSIVLGTPILYLLIDRWSRFILSSAPRQRMSMARTRSPHIHFA